LAASLLLHFFAFSFTLLFNSFLGFKNNIFSHCCPVNIKYLLSIKINVAGLVLLYFNPRHESDTPTSDTP
jgi:hypothetical protein